MDFLAKYKFWKERATESSVVESLRHMEGNTEEIQNAFSEDLQFGTAGLRGIMTAGTGRMNVYTVYRATEGLARYMVSQKMSSCAITYDSRNNSLLFSQMAAATLASHGITVHITKECMPTPFLSYMIRYLHCDMGINVTASHNPSEYNGYKVYDEMGCQLLDEPCVEVMRFISQVDPFEKPLPNFEQFVNEKIFYSQPQVEEEYVRLVKEQSLNDATGLKAVYTPLNGAGYRIVPQVLKDVGLTEMLIVPEQATPNGDFPTCSYPNPEKHEALTLAINLAKQSGADIVIANDPDCDRLGVAEKDGEDYRIFSGNEVGILLVDYILTQMQNKGILPQNAVVVKTIVTTIMVDAICNKHGVKVTDVLTGFKYIGNVINNLQKVGEQNRYIFGFEESCGYLKGSYVRDKDGVVASMLVAQCASYYKKLGKTLCQRLEELYVEHGNFYQKTESYKFEGVTGAERKNQLLASLRQKGFTQLGESKVVATCDFMTQTTWDLPKADVLRYNSEDGSQLIVRPSGTEPLIKCYITVQGDKQGNAVRYQNIKAQMDKIFG